MAIAVQMDFEGGTTDQYDQVIERMRFGPNGPGAPGSLFHWVTQSEPGIRVTDVWESKEQFEKFG